MIMHFAARWTFGKTFGTAHRLLQIAAAGLAGGLLALSAAAIPAHAETTHTIQPGDSLGTLAQEYDVDASRLAEYNGIGEPDHIVIGQQIRIPIEVAGHPTAGTSTGTSTGTSVDTRRAEDALPGSGGYHVVTAGESLSTIASRYDLEQAELLRINDLNDADTVVIGQMLQLTDDVRQTSPQRRASSTRLAESPRAADAIHIVGEDETLSEIAKGYDTTVDELIAANGLPNAGFVYAGQRLRIRKTADSAADNAAVNADAILNTEDAPPYGARRIVIDLSDQTLTAYQGDVQVLHTTVSTGKAATPTKRGEFNIYLKYESQRMTGPDYDLPGVPWVMYYDDDFAIHGAYWHTNFGVPMSHGCVNMRIDEAKALYEWAHMETPVVVQW